MSLYDNLNKEISNKSFEKENDSQIENNKSHSFQIRFFSKPILCSYCKDFIWGEGHLGYGCLNCSKCIHSKCKIFISLVSCMKNDQTSLDLITRPNIYPVENWSVNIVKEWLAVVNLHRYAEIFATYNINGSKLLSLDIYQLYAFRIRDSYHHAAILQARDELIYKSRMYTTYQEMIVEQEEAKSHLISNQYKSSHHHFLVHSISKLTDCNICKRPLLGILHQCLMCQKCGLLTHRQCSATGLPACKINNSELKPKKHFIFGVSLFDMLSNDQSSEGNSEQVPLIMVKAFKNIEERALNNNEDLYDVYRLSADTSKIDLIKQQINENGIELIQFDRFDLNTIAALVKTFLRDLQDSIIPEAIYGKLVNKIQTCSSEELRSLINLNLNPLNLSCLKYIMSHLIRVWSYQHRVRGCHYLPDKLFHIFRSILLRPSWENITEIVYNIENQTLVIQRLMLEYDWGVELPEYKVRPKRPINPSNEHESSPTRQLTNQKSSKSLNNILNIFTNQTASNVQSNTESRRYVNIQDSINENQWYWGTINRDDTFLILKNCPDGSFLVRDSTDKSLDAPYTLCVMKSSVKSIKIFKQDQPGNGNCLYDIEKPCRFESLSALVSYYSRVSLKEYNHNLDIVLTYGVSKYKFGKTTEWSIDKLYSSFKDAFQEYEQLTKRFEDLESEISNVREDLNQKKLASEAFDKIIQLYTQQLEQVDRIISENLIKKTNAISTTRLLASQLMPTSLTGQATNPIADEEITRLDDLMKQNREKISQRIYELHAKKEALKTDVDYLNTVVNQLQEELDFLRPELIEIRKKRENYHMWLVQRGENDDKIQSKLKHLSKSDFDDSLGDKISNSNLSSSFSDKLPNQTEASANSIETIKKPSLSPANTAADLAILASKTDCSETHEVDTSSILKTNDSPHLNSLNWYAPDFDREKANEALKSKPNGTYLVRPNSKPNSKYILSLVCQNETKHVLIDENQTGCFIKSSFNQRRLQNQNREQDDDLKSTTSNNKLLSSSLSASSLSSMNSFGSGSQLNEELYATSRTQEVTKFNTLTELIFYYSQNQIKTNNIILDTFLLYPVFLNSKT